MAASGYIATFLIKPQRLRMWLKFWGKGNLWAVRTILKGTIEVRGLENLPKDQPYIIAAKHQSELDVLVMVSLFPDMTTVAMKSLEQLPFFGRILHALGYIIVDMDKPENLTEQVIKGARLAHTEGRPIVIYPEGTLMSLGAKQRYRRGIWHIYNDLGAKVTPVAMSVGVIWPRRDKQKYIGKTGAFDFLPPIEPNMDQDTFMALLEDTIEMNTMRLIEEHADGKILVDAKDRYIRGAANEDLPWQQEQENNRSKAVKNNIKPN